MGNDLPSSPGVLTPAIHGVTLLAQGPLTSNEMEARIMATNIEKLTEQLNALMDYDPMALECTDAKISQVPGERRIYLQSTLESAVFHIDFDQVMPYDPDGAEGTTSDVFAGAQISLTVEHSDDALHTTKADADKFAKGYLKMVRFSLSDAAKEGRISSKTLAEMRFSVAAIRKRERGQKRAEKEAKESSEQFLNSVDPVTREAILKTGKEIQAKRKKEGKK
jgi:hypothetical protein